MMRKKSPKWRDSNWRGVQRLPLPSKKRFPVGSIFFLSNKSDAVPYRRGPKGMIYTAKHGTDPTLCRAFFKRERRRAKSWK